MLAAATGVASGLFGKSSSLSAYTLHSSTPIGSPATSSTNLPSLAGSPSKGFAVGLWRVVGATHKTTNKDVSVWIFDKKVLEGVRGATQTREWAIEQLKKEATSLSRLRHPDLLHMVEPLEETRSELTFVTEYITSSLANLISAASSKRKDGQSRPPTRESSVEIDLDEVEIQKGTLQIAKALMFLHQQAKMVHLNITPDAILVNAKGDWKLSGLNLTTPLQQPDGLATKYVYPEVDARLPPQIQWKLDYLAPEYALDSSLTPASDLYSLGCVLFAVHMGGKPPFQNRGSMSSLRENAEGPLVTRTWASGSRWERCGSEIKDLLPRLLTRHPNQRISIQSLPSHQFFSSLAINTLNFLDPTAFASKPREEKATFLKGLVRVLPTFSDRLRRKKILPSLLEEMKDPYLLPFLLPNVFEIAKTLSPEAFTPVLTKLQPLFALRDPPQNMLTLLEHLSLFEEKTTPPAFREHVMPLIYNSLECEHMPVQEKVLKLVPHLCEILDYGTVQNVLLVNVAILFTKTRILSIKIQTLECFKAMVKTLDKATLTTKLVPLLAKIKTKEPAVMMATLAVHEAMGSKVDREAVATLVLPQLWAMSMGPLLNADQFAKFMGVIKTLGSRVEEEHAQHLRDVRRIEQQTSTYNQTLEDGSAFSTNGINGGEMNFEDLVKGKTSPAPPSSNTAGGLDPWDSGWADSNGESSLSNAFASTSMSPSPFASPNPGNIQPTSSGSRLKARPVAASTFNSSVFNNPSSASSSTANSPNIYSTPSFSPIQPQITSFTPLQPTQSTLTPLQPQQSTFTPPPQNQGPGSGSGLGPNYNISLAPSAPAPRPAQNSSLAFMSPPSVPGGLARPQSQTFSPPPSAQTSARPPPSQTTTLTPSKPPPGYSSGLMQPTVVAKPSIPTVNGKVDWGDFDPLK